MIWAREKITLFQSRTPLRGRVGQAMKNLTFNGGCISVKTEMKPDDKLLPLAVDNFSMFKNQYKSFSQYKNTPYAREYEKAKKEAETHELLKGLFNGIALPVIIPKIEEEDPGSYFIDHVIPEFQSLHRTGKLASVIEYASDTPLEFRLTPVTHFRHQKLLDKAQSQDIPAWFFPSVVGLGINELKDLLQAMPTNVSLAGFNDGWPIIMQYPTVFWSLCSIQSFWFSGVTSETSGVGFCLKTNADGKLVLIRDSFTNIQPNDLHGLILTAI